MNLQFETKAENSYSIHCVYNIVKGCYTVFHRKFQLLEYWKAAWGKPDVKYIAL